MWRKEGCPKRTLCRGARRMGRRQQRGKMGDGGVAGYVAPLTHTPPTPLVGMVATSKREKESRGRLVTREGGLGEGRENGWADPSFFGGRREAVPIFGGPFLRPMNTSAVLGAGTRKGAKDDSRQVLWNFCISFCCCCFVHFYPPPLPSSSFPCSLSFLLFLGSGSGVGRRRRRVKMDACTWRRRNQFPSYFATGEEFLLCFVSLLFEHSFSTSRTGEKTYRGEIVFSPPPPFSDTLSTAVSERGCCGDEVKRRRPDTTFCFVYVCVSGRDRPPPPP